MYLNFDVKRFEKYSFVNRTSHILKDVYVKVNTCAEGRIAYNWTYALKRRIWTHLIIWVESEGGRYFTIEDH